VDTGRIQKIENVIARRQPGPGILLENVFDPHNIAAVMRTCDSVGIGAIHALYTEAPPHHLTGFRSSAGAWKWVEKIEHENTQSCMAAMKAKFGRVYAAHLSPTATSIYDFDFTQPVALVFGNEQKGCSDEILALCDGAIYIPQMGMVQSLNISVACAIILYEAFRQKNAAGHYHLPQLSEEERLALLARWTDPHVIREQKNRKA
jgi:tRNA (guanosine-2'-O-)-methyltransferase